MRRVAVQTASAAVTASAAAAAAHVHAPVASAPAMRCCRYRPNTAAPAIPATAPHPIGSILCHKSLLRNPPGDAPSAMRTPISCVRCAME